MEAHELYFDVNNKMVFNPDDEPMLNTEYRADYLGPSPFTITGTTGITEQYYSIPYGVTSLQVECWGGGGGGSSLGIGSRRSGGGGGGGAYSKRNTITVIPYKTYLFSVSGPVNADLDGSDTSFTGESSVQCLAKGGKSEANFRIGGIGGLATESVGDIKYDGGWGGTAPATDYTGGGGGGESGCSTSNGNHGSVPGGGIGGAGGTGTDGGDGGKGGDSGEFPFGEVGDDGVLPGGGGGGVGGESPGGGYYSLGGAGQIIVTY